MRSENLNRRLVRTAETSPDDELLREPEARAFLKIGKTKLWSLTNQKVIPHVRIGKRGLRYRRESLKAWLAENEIGGPAG